MSYFKFENRDVFYEVIGEGEPLVILNGIFMSTNSWKLLTPYIYGKKVILFDFLDQIQSEKLETEYDQNIHVETIKKLLEHLKLEKIDLMGISYGGEIALKFALKYQNNIRKMALFNTTSYTNPWLLQIGEAWINAAQTYNPEIFYKAAIPTVYSPHFYTKNIEKMKIREKVLYRAFTKDFLDASVRLIKSAENYDVREKLQEIEIPVLVVGSTEDYITPIKEQEYIAEKIRNSSFLIIPNCGHGSMYEKPNEFLAAVNGFFKDELYIKIF